MALLTPQAADLLTDGFNTIIDETIYDRWDPVFSTVFNVDSSTKPDENDSEISGFGTFAVRSEHASLAMDDPIQAFDTTYTHVEFAKGFEVSRIMMEDDQYGKIRRMPQQLAVAFTETVESDAANDLNRGFDSAYKGGDGIELFSTVHPLVGGGTFANEPASAADLDATSLEQAFIDIKAWVDHRGKKLRARPQRLIYPSALNWTVQKLFGSERDPDSANNAINPARNSIPETTEWLHLTDSDAWFIQCNGHFMRFFWRRMPETGRDGDFSTDGIRHKLTARLSHGWSSPFFMYGSPGV